jgi:hypothetical protein
MITDPCYVKDFVDDAHDSVQSDLNGSHPITEKLPYSYGGACAASCSDKQGAALDEGMGTVISTGYGDGDYPVYVEYEDGRVARVIVEFMEYNEEDEPED